MHRRVLGVGVGVFLAVAAYGCGSSDTSVSSSVHQQVSAAADGTEMRTVEYEGVAFDVPADWPVNDLAADPTMCVRFDVHAVYLGNPSADMNCPAGGVGSTEAVLVQPIERTTDGLSGQVSTMDVNGLSAEVSDQRASMGQLQADVGDVRVSVTTGPDSDALAQQILQSFRAAGQ